MKKSIIRVILLFLIASFFIFNSSPRIMDKAIGDIDGDGKLEEIVLTKLPFFKYGKEVVISSSEGDEIFREDFSNLKPWKVAIGDIDGDGIGDISVGVYKETLFHPVMDKRPFIYSYKDKRLHPKWRGSRLSKPFTDYIFYDIDNDTVDEIISIERMENGEKVINTYKWTGFGFEGLVQSRNYEDILNIYLKNDMVYVDYKEGGSKVGGILVYYDNNIRIEGVVSND